MDMKMDLATETDSRLADRCPFTFRRVRACMHKGLAVSYGTPSLFHAHLAGVVRLWATDLSVALARSTNWR